MFSRDVCGRFRKCVSANIGCCVVLGLFFMFSVFLTMLPEYIRVYELTHSMVRCVLMLRCGLAGVVWYPYRAIQPMK